HWILTAEPASPARLNASVDRDLETICLACLEKEPQRRYPSANDVAEELERWLRGEPILRRPTGPATRLVKWSRRRPAIAALAATTALAILLGVSGMAWQWGRTREANQRLAAEVSRARRELAEQHFRDGASAAALRVLASHLRQQPNDIDSATRLWGALARRAWSLPESEFAVPDLIAVTLWHPRGHQLALVTAKTALATNLDLTVVESTTGRRLAGPFALAGRSGAVDYSRDGRWLFSIIAGEARLLDSSTLNTSAAPFATNLVCGDFVWHPDGRRVLLADRDAALLVDVMAAPTLAGAEARWFSMPSNVLAVALRPDGQTVAVGDESGHVRVWNAESARVLTELPQLTKAIASLLLPSTGQRLVTRQSDAQLRLWELPSGRELAHLPSGSPLASAGTAVGW
ncbi:MAG: hypothetical protein L0Z50_02605, partial [Verrucomicrobiales bacterium]|nr:hypothetical protein [Verrucomicrobiales bacterium]